MKASFTVLNEKMDSLVSEFGFYKTANLIADAYELDHITEHQGCSLRFMLAMKYERVIRKCGDHFLGIETLDLDTPICEAFDRALYNRRRTDCTFESVVNGTPINPVDESIAALMVTV